MSESKPGLLFLAGASLVLPDRVEVATLVVRDGRIAEIVSGPRAVGGNETRLDFGGHLIVPGFVDVHVHGLHGADVLDDDGAVAEVASHLPRHGVTAFCPTSTACDPVTLSRFLSEVGRLRQAPPAGARVLAAHLESNFLNPEYRGAQPLDCLRAVTTERIAWDRGDPFSGRDVLEVVDRHRADVGIFTLAPEVEGAAALVRALVAAGTRVSLGHTGATYEQAMQAFADGARQVTHLFNRMRPFGHRDPGVVGAALGHDDVVVELICDGRHVHPASMRVAIAAKGPARVMAITDATAGAGLPEGATARLGGRTIEVRDVARLPDGTMAGSVLTMDRAFATLVTACGFDLVEAARMCSTTPARALDLVGHGVLAPGSVADFVILDAQLRVVETWVGGRRACRAAPSDGETLEPDPAA
jgi:N-acetylglucosamine-6-phosphate deacetylase